MAVIQDVGGCGLDIQWCLSLIFQSNNEIIKIGLHADLEYPGNKLSCKVDIK
jgi:hypothetical protein